MNDRHFFGVVLAKELEGRSRIYIEQGIYTSVGVIRIRFLAGIA
jgi:acid stress-induced BolA-like protein IbaG/YrbA